MFDRYYGLNRTVCDVLSEMRKCHETHNYGYLPSLIEEVQSMANRMESKLGDVADLKQLDYDLKQKRKELKRLREEITKAKNELGKDDDLD